MSDLARVPHADTGRRSPTLERITPVGVLATMCILLFVFPSDSVLEAIGASGFVGGIFAVVMFSLWLASIMLGLHRPWGHRSPTRTGFMLLWIVSLASYALRPWNSLSVPQAASADRWLILLAGMTGVAFVANDCLTTMDDIVRTMRALVTGASVSAAIGALQFWFSFDVVPFIRAAMPGFTAKGTDVSGQVRGTLVRVSGTAANPLELAVISGALLPAAIFLAMYDSDRPLARRVIPVALLLSGVAATVSRSGVLAVFLAASIWVCLLPALQRVIALAIAPLGAVAIFMTAPGFMRIIAQLATAGNSDPSIAHRTQTYKLVGGLIGGHPWLGTGGGTYLPVDAFHIFDNEYLMAVVQLGVLGLLATLVLLFAPALSALMTSRRLADARERALGAVLGGAGVAIAVCAATFDIFSFAMVTFAASILLGLLGAYVQVARSRISDPPGNPPFGVRVFASPLDSLPREFPAVTSAVAGKDPVSGRRTQ